MEIKNEGKKHADRIRSLLKRERPDRVPVWPFFDMTGFAAVYHQRPISDAYRDPKTSLMLQRKVCKDFGWACSPFFPAFGVTDFGGEIKLPDSEFSQAPSTLRFPIQSEEDIDRFEIPDISKTKGILRETEFHKQAIEEPFENEPFKAMILLFHANPFETVNNILCGLELSSRWMLKKPELIHKLLKISKDILQQEIDYWYDTIGTENILLFSGGVTCSNQLISPKLFEKFVLPHLKEAQEKILARGFERFYCHICGEHNKNMPFWQQVPMGDPGIVSIGHEVELATAAEYFPNDIILGNLEPAIMQTATPDKVYNETATVIKKGKALSGGFIFSMGCQFPPRATLENVEAMNQAVYDFGKYD